MRHYAYLSTSLFLTQQHHNVEIPPGQLVPQPSIFPYDSCVVFHSVDGLRLVLIPAHERLLCHVYFFRRRLKCCYNRSFHSMSLSSGASLSYGSESSNGNVLFFNYTVIALIAFQKLVMIYKRFRTETSPHPY